MYTCDIFIHSFHFISRASSVETTTRAHRVAKKNKFLKSIFHSFLVKNKHAEGPEELNEYHLKSFYGKNIKETTVTIIVISKKVDTSEQ